MTGQAKKIPATKEPTYQPGPKVNQVRSPEGTILTAPADWELLPPGDTALTRRVKAAGKYWLVQQQKGRRKFSLGIWAPSATIHQIRQDLEAERATEEYARRQASSVRRREKVQTEYVEDFFQGVISFLRFHSEYTEYAETLARLVVEHATPVGSGTVARTQRIPLERRVEAAVIAWMRHQTSGYDSMKIARVKGKRREVRRMLAQRSRELLESYRRGNSVSADCPLMRILAEKRETGE